MPYEMWPAVLLGISLFTNLGIEGLKHLYSPKKIANKNLMALFISFCLSGLAWLWYILNNHLKVSELGVVEFVFFIYLTFITTTVGYDKVLKTFKELKTGGMSDEQ